jgi:hypothetical protein
MHSFIRSFAALPTVLMLAACGAPPGEDAASDSAEAMTINPIRPIPVTGPVWVRPTYYTSVSTFGPGNAPSVQMEPVATSVCVLTGVSGGFAGWGSVAQIVMKNGYYYLETSPFTEVMAACVPVSDFTGTGTGSIESTANSPWGVSASLNQSSIGYDTSTLNLWSSNSICTLSGFAGDWTGVHTGLYAEAPILTTYITGSYSNVIETNGPGILSYSNCFEFPGRSSVTQTTLKANASGSPTLSLPNQNVALCGLSAYIGPIDGIDSATIVQNANGTQTLELAGRTSSASATCMSYAQQGS